MNAYMYGARYLLERPLSVAFHYINDMTHVVIAVVRR